MKKKILFTSALSLLSFVGFSQSLWDNFDDTRNAAWGFTHGVLNQDFNNPNKTGINTSDKCAQYTRNGGEQYDVIVVNPSPSFVAGDVSDLLSGASKMTMKVFTTDVPIGTTVQITLENKTAAGAGYPTGRHSVYTAVTTTQNAWEELQFNYQFQPDASVSNTSVDQAVILFNPDSFTNNTYLFDDLSLTNLTERGFLYDDFDGSTNVEYNFIDGTIQTVTNPAPNAVNGSTNVGRFDKNATLESPIVLSHFGNLIMEDITEFVNGTKKMTMDFYYPVNFAPFEIRIKLQNGGLAFTGTGNDGVHSIYYATYNNSQNWETLVFEKDNGYTPAPNTSVTNIDEVRIEIDFTFAGVDTYYIDNIFGPASFDKCPAVITDNLIFEDAECQRNLVYEFWNGGFGAVPNPVTTGINTSPLAMRLVKEESTSTIPEDGAFGGIFGNNFIFTSDDYFKAKIQLHNPGGNVPGDTLAVVLRDIANNDLSYIKVPLLETSKTQWVEYTIDFSFISPSIDISGFILLFNPHTFTKDGVYFDNFRLVDPLSAKTIAKNDLNIYPNPSNGIINITSDNLISKVSVYDLTGRLISNHITNTNATNVNIENLNSGTYMVEIVFIDGSKQTKKVSKL